MHTLLLFLIFSLFFFILRPQKGLSCGLFGLISSTLDATDIKIMHQLSYLTCFRGTDSTGVIGLSRVKKGIDATISKEAWNPVAFFESKKFHEEILKREPFGILAHSRAATIGAINAANAHPFKYKHIMGMHNGTVHRLGGNGKTDSEELMQLIADEGIDAALDVAKYGAYALVFIDTSKKTLNFIHNNERPLHYLNSSNQTFIYASEKRQLEYLVPYHSELKAATIEMFETHTLYTMDILTGAIDKRVINPLQYKGASHSVYSPWHDTADDDNVVPYRREVTRVGTPPRIERKPGPGSCAVLQVDQLGYPYNFTPALLEEDKKDLPKKSKQTEEYKYQGWRNFVYSLEEAKNMLLDGCSFCGTQVIDFNKPVYWYAEDEYLCAHCQTSPLVHLRKDDSCKGKLVRAH